VKYLRRIIWFIATRLLVICLLLGLMITVFYYTMNLSNIQIILKDGMAGRAKYIMGITDSRNELSRYFQELCLENDTMIQQTAAGNSLYADYSVRGIDHRLDLDFFWLWPWENSVRVSIHEQIPRIDGRVKGSRAEEVIARSGSGALYPPDWPDADYRVILVRENGQWKIKTLTVVSR